MASWRRNGFARRRYGTLRTYVHGTYVPSSAPRGSRQAAVVRSRQGRLEAAFRRGEAAPVRITSDICCGSVRTTTYVCQGKDGCAASKRPDATVAWPSPSSVHVCFSVSFTWPRRCPVSSSLFPIGKHIRTYSTYVRVSVYLVPRHHIQPQSPLPSPCFSFFPPLLPAAGQVREPVDPLAASSSLPSPPPPPPPRRALRTGHSDFCFCRGARRRRSTGRRSRPTGAAVPDGS